MENRLKTVMREKGFTREQLAERVGAHHITISKLIAGTITMNTSWMERLGKALGVPPIEIIVAPMTTRTITVNASVQAGVFSESHEWLDRDAWYQIAIPDDPDLQGLTLYAAEVRGPSMNRRFPEGTVVVFSAPWEDGDEPIPGKRYIVERKKPDGLIETTVKLLHQDNDGGYWLIAETNDPRFQAPINVHDQELEDEVRIIGRVRYAVTRE